MAAKKKAPCRIQMFLHCRQCIASIPPGESAETWARLTVGWTKAGLQVWCVRHELSVTEIELDGVTLPH